VSLCDLFFGAELEAYVPVNAATKRVMDLSAAWNCCRELDGTGWTELDELKTMF
jgi:hypothetical protein